MTTCPTTAEELDRMIIESAKEVGSETVGESSSIEMVLRSGKVVGIKRRMKGGARKCSLVGLALCSVIFIAASWAAFTGCTISIPVLVGYINKTMPGVTDSAFSLGKGLIDYLTQQFTGMCDLMKAQMKMKGESAFKVIFDELSRNALSYAGLATIFSAGTSRAVSVLSSAKEKLSEYAMEICVRGEFIIDDGLPEVAPADVVAASAPVPEAPSRQAAPAAAGSYRQSAPAPAPSVRRGRDRYQTAPAEEGEESDTQAYSPYNGGKKHSNKSKKEKKSMRGGRRRSMAKSKKNRGK